ncbi:metal-dependent transcriptional regulator [Niabella sp. CC-SYL272]|uniref:metal-dependent transcriptional regulator n=1 Tax=Niabella agricola TaxID=2891571 RepID=UPI001F1DF08D|nr:metal-dependent transcriptional regulator [Niabella agricola]MCF3109531.1 metal-dependent transcriptional regulator [Niabella agricola]
MLSNTEENYLKALLYLTSEDSGKKEAGTNDLAIHLGLKPATVNDMLKRLKEKEYVSYKKYGKISLTRSGKDIAMFVMRKHRLWETFLCEVLEFSWDEVHEVAEQLEHIQSDKLTERLDKFLNYPDYDPHGDPIPKPNGKMPSRATTLLSSVAVQQSCTVAAVKDTSPVFLQYLEQLSIGIGTKIKVLEKISFDGSMTLLVEKDKLTVSEKFANSLLVE